MSNEKCKDVSQNKLDLPGTAELSVPHPSQEVQMSKQDFNKQFEEARKLNTKADAWLANHFDQGNAPQIVDEGRVNGGGGGGRGGSSRFSPHHEVIDRADQRAS